MYKVMSCYELSCLFNSRSILVIHAFIAKFQVMLAVSVQRFCKIVLTIGLIKRERSLFTEWSVPKRNQFLFRINPTVNHEQSL